MRRAGSAATERGSNRKSKDSFRSSAKPTKSSAPAQAAERHFLTITDGRITLGWVGQYGKTFTATLAPDHAAIGDFTSLKAAADAVSAACVGRPYGEAKPPEAAENITENITAALAGQSAGAGGAQ